MERKLIKAFISELQERQGRCMAMLADCSHEQMTAGACEKLAQEFDSLVGAARVINRPDIEEFARQVTLFVRHMQQQQKSGIGRGEYDLLVRAAAHLELLVRELSGQKARHQTVDRLTGDIKAAMQTADESIQE